MHRVMHILQGCRDIKVRRDIIHQLGIRVARHVISRFRHGGIVIVLIIYGTIDRPFFIFGKEASATTKGLMRILSFEIINVMESITI